VGIGIGMLFGYELVPAVLLGIIFVSSSIAIIVPSLQASGLLSTQFGRTIVAAAIFEDIASLILLSIVLQAVNPITRLPLPVFFGILAIFFLVIFLLRSSTAKIRWFFIFDAKHSRDIFERELRMAIALLIGAVIFFQLIGLHAIIAGFFVGLLLSEATKSQILREKIHGIGYSIFIPIFFVLVGSQTNIRIFLEARDAIIITAVVIGGSVLSKFLSGWFAGRLNGLSTHKSVVLGAATTPQLSTTLAVVFTAQGLNLISAELVSALVALSIVTTLIGPLVIAQFARVSAREEERSVALAQAHL
jgi:Kef-type K+ transport system membrane component KefB